MTRLTRGSNQSKNGQVDNQEIEQSVHIEQSEIQQSLWTGNVGILVSRHLSEGLKQKCPIQDFLEKFLFRPGRAPQWWPWTSPAHPKAHLQVCPPEERRTSFKCTLLSAQRLLPPSVVSTPTSLQILNEFPTALAWLLASWSPPCSGSHVCWPCLRTPRGFSDCLQIKIAIR